MQYFHAAHVSCAASSSSLVAPGFGVGSVASVGGGGGEGRGREAKDGERRGGEERRGGVEGRRGVGREYEWRGKGHIE